MMDARYRDFVDLPPNNVLVGCIRMPGQRDKHWMLVPLPFFVGAITPAKPPGQLFQEFNRRIQRNV